MNRRKFAVDCRGAFVLAGLMSLWPQTAHAHLMNTGFGPFYDGVMHLALSPDDSQAWVPSKQDNVLRGTVRNGFPLTHDSTVRAITSRIDLLTGVEDEVLSGVAAVSLALIGSAT